MNEELVSFARELAKDPKLKKLWDNVEGGALELIVSRCDVALAKIRAGPDEEAGTLTSVLNKKDQAFRTAVTILVEECKGKNLCPPLIDPDDILRMGELKRR